MPYSTWKKPKSTEESKDNLQATDSNARKTADKPECPEPNPSNIGDETNVGGLTWRFDSGG